MIPSELENLDASPISAYAKLEFELFSFFIQTLTLIIGRKAKRDDNVDVHLGMSKSISRQHAKIYYQFSATSWEIEVLGKNGAFVNDRYVEAGGTCELKNTDRLQIADALFTFLLPEGSAPPIEPLAYSDPFFLDNLDTITLETIAPEQILRKSTQRPDSALSPTPLAPHHLMQKPDVSLVDGNKHVEPSATNTNDNVNTKTDRTKVVAANKDIEEVLDGDLNNHLGDEDSTHKTPGKKQRKKYTRKGQTEKTEDGLIDAKSVLPEIAQIEMPELITEAEPIEIITEEVDTAEVQAALAKAEAERKVLEDELAAQQAAQLLHQERLARQAQEEEEGLLLPPPETDPLVIASLQKPSASYATMIYNAITSHEKKKMTLAQIYSWICIYHPYYRYVQNGWQNSIRHNLSLNKAFMKVPRTDDEPGKGAFWAVDPDSEVLFEGGVYKKKPPRPPTSTPHTRGAPIVMKTGKLALNPSFFLGQIQGKAEDVLGALHDTVNRQLPKGNHTDLANLMVRLLALALAAQLKTSTLDAAALRQMTQTNAQSVTVSQPSALNVAQVNQNQNQIAKMPQSTPDRAIPPVVSIRSGNTPNNGAVAGSTTAYPIGNLSTTAPKASSTAQQFRPPTCTNGQMTSAQASARLSTGLAVAGTNPAAMVKPVQASHPVLSRPIGTPGSNLPAGVSRAPTNNSARVQVATQAPSTTPKTASNTAQSSKAYRIPPYNISAAGSKHVQRPLPTDVSNIRPASVSQVSRPAVSQLPGRPAAVTSLVNGKRSSDVAALRENGSAPKLIKVDTAVTDATTKLAARPNITPAASAGKAGLPPETSRPTSILVAKSSDPFPFGSKTSVNTIPSTASLPNAKLTTPPTSSIMTPKNIAPGSTTTIVPSDRPATKSEVLPNAAAANPLNRPTLPTQMVSDATAPGVLPSPTPLKQASPNASVSGVKPLPTSPKQAS